MVRGDRLRGKIFCASAVLGERGYWAGAEWELWARWRADGEADGRVVHETRCIVLCTVHSFRFAYLCRGGKNCRCRLVKLHTRSPTRFFCPSQLKDGVGHSLRIVFHGLQTQLFNISVLFFFFSLFVVLVRCTYGLYNGVYRSSERTYPEPL